MRGEYSLPPGIPAGILELPPRARRIRDDEEGDCLVRGTTSACAENTVHDTIIDAMRGNYLRVRGEYGFWGWGVSGYQELPPRARRIPCLSNSSHLPTGTTSACAENTTSIFDPPGTPGNYLRVRGEYICAIFARTISAELPPRARRILFVFGGFKLDFGTTSACAENTPDTFASRNIPGNYLRVRGEYPPQS